MQPSEIEAIYRREAGRVLATLIRLLGDFELAQDARQEAFAVALDRWPQSGVPDNPRAWLVEVGRNKALDQMRRAQVFKDKVLPLEKASADEATEEGEHADAAFGDDRLRLIFTCCHPALNPEVQVALTLRAVCGLSTEAVARAFLVAEDAMAQRLVRAQRKIREAGIPYEIPEAPLLDERMQSVLAVIYSVFTEGYAVTSGERLIAVELCLEAIRLGRLMDALLPQRPDVLGLLALMLLHDARREARLTATGDIVLLEHQDAALWDEQQIEEGLVLVEQALRVPGRVSVYAVQAAIAALHARAPAEGRTDWPQIAALYEVLLRLQPTPVVELNRAVAVSMVDGPEKALQLVDSLSARGGFTEYHLLYVVRADLLKRLGRRDEALAAYREARATAKTEPERRFLQGRMSELEQASPT
ncbi:MAG TPA: RNA polymerase sigma factor [Gammaproteobacteria bacterium]